MSIAPQKWVSNLVNQANAHTHTHGEMRFNEAAYIPFPHILVDGYSASGTLRWSPLGPYLMGLSFVGDINPYFV